MEDRINTKFSLSIPLQHGDSSQSDCDFDFEVISLSIVSTTFYNLRKIDRILQNLLQLGDSSCDVRLCGFGTLRLLRSVRSEVLHHDETPLQSSLLSELNVDGSYLVLEICYPFLFQSIFVHYPLLFYIVFTVIDCVPVFSTLTLTYNVFVHYHFLLDLISTLRLQSILWDNDVKSTKHTLKEMIMHFSSLEHPERKAVIKFETLANLAKYIILRFAGDLLMELGAGVELATTVVPDIFLPLACAAKCGQASIFAMAPDNSAESNQRKPGLLKDQVQLVKQKDIDRYEIVPIQDPLSFEKGFFIVIRACQLLAQKNDGLILVGLAGPSGAGKTVY
ncbi:hypothetical protein ACSBR1_020726 [Camellia fascicularis]